MRLPRPVPQAGRGPLAHAVEREDGRLLERRGEERARGVRLVVLGEDEPPAVLRPPSPGGSPAAGAASAAARAASPEERAEAARARRPGRSRAAARTSGAACRRSRRSRGRSGSSPASSRQYAIAWVGKPVVVLLAREALFLGGGDDPPVDDQRGRRVVVEGGDAEDSTHLSGVEDSHVQDRRRWRPAIIAFSPCPSGGGRTANDDEHKIVQVLAQRRGDPILDGGGRGRKRTPNRCRF